jgi:hypothetical protein
VCECIYIIYSKFTHWILLGDFNFDSERNFELDGLPVENNILSTVMPNAVDTWAALNPERSSGKTFDSGTAALFRHRLILKQINYSC